MKRKNLDIYLYLFVSLILFLLKMFVKGEVGADISILAIGFFLVSSIYFAKRNNESIFFIFALAFTLMSDSFLSGYGVFSNSRLSFAMTTFSLVQLSYMIILYNNEDKRLFKSFALIRIISFIILMIIAIVVLKENINYIVIMALFYIVNLIVNCIESFFNKERYRTLWIGFIFFIMCDVFIGINYMFLNNMFGLNETSAFYEILLFINKIDFSWLCYIIAQSLIVLSIGLSNKKEKVSVWN